MNTINDSETQEHPEVPNANLHGKEFLMRNSVHGQVERIISSDPYDIYTNAPQVIGRKKSLDAMYSNSRMMKPVITAEQILSILQGIRKVAEPTNIRATKVPLERVTDIVRSFLENTGKLRLFSHMGFSIDSPYVGLPSNISERGHYLYKEHSAPKVETSSGTAVEFSYIAFHQALETLYCDILFCLEQITEENSKEDKISSDLEYASMLFDTASSLYNVQEQLVDSNALAAAKKENPLTRRVTQSKQMLRIHKLLSLPGDGSDLEDRSDGFMSLQQKFPKGSTPVEFLPLLSKLDDAILRFKMRNRLAALKYIDSYTMDESEIRQISTQKIQTLFHHSSSGTELPKIQKGTYSATDSNEKKGDDFSDLIYPHII